MVFRESQKCHMQERTPGPLPAGPSPQHAFGGQPPVKSEATSPARRAARLVSFSTSPWFSLFWRKETSDTQGFIQNKEAVPLASCNFSSKWEVFFTLTMIIITMARKHLHPVRIRRQSWSGKCFPELGDLLVQTLELQDNPSSVS